MKLFRVFVITLFAFAICHLPFVIPVNAQIPPSYIPCSETADPEFHSLRPYQASPCNKSFDELSYICGNDLRVRDNITVTPSQAQSCQVSSAGAICHFNLPREFWFSIDPDQSEFPIAGNTENVINSQSQVDELNDAQKVNEYVSWYLNGVINRAEYGDTKNTDSEIVNFSGPIKKLLPSVIQEAQRIDTIQAAAVTRHNQIAVCAQEGILGIWGKTKAHECYEGNNTAAKPDVYRLDGWNGDLSLLRAALNLINPLDAWNKRIPPLPWDFESDILYRKAYNEWRGKSCLILPIIGLQCIDNPLIRNKWADLYPYIPLSSTEDRLGKLTASDAIVEDPDGVEVADLETTWRNKPPSERHEPLKKNESALFFAHMEENVKLTDLLQSTYLGKNELKMTQVIGETTPPSIGSFCKIVDVRYNKGDQLFGEFIAADVSYTAIFDCTFPVRPIIDPVTGEVIGYEPYGECTKSVIFASKIDVGTPKIDELWAKTVAGNASVFKRIFPKVGSQSPVDEIKDIPGVSPIIHDTDIELLSTNPEIYFPHLGGILEYFLKGIQTMLRPKGYGENVSSSTTPNGSCTPGEGNVDAAIADAASRYGKPAGLLRAIFQIEGVEYIANPQNYVCSENTAGAAGVMQITQGAYQLVTCENERMADNLAACSEPGKLSRCVIHDAFELAARVLLSRVGLWSYSDCKPLGTFPNNKQDIYNAACRYYGSFSPDIWTIHAAQQWGLPDPNNKNYCDVVCFIMGLCPPFPSH